MNQIEANRKNALLSTGPRTIEGKVAASKNALKHGLRSKELLLPDEKQVELEELAISLKEELTPVGILEEIIVERIIACVWRLRRALRVEGLFLGRVLHMAKDDAYWQKGDGWGHVFQWRRGEEASAWQSLINKYEVSIERSLFRNLKELKRLQSERMKCSQQELPFVEAKVLEGFS